MIKSMCMTKNTDSEQKKAGLHTVTFNERPTILITDTSRSEEERKDRTSGGDFKGIVSPVSLLNAKIRRRMQSKKFQQILLCKENYIFEYCVRNILYCEPSCKHFI